MHIAGLAVITWPKIQKRNTDRAFAELFLGFLVRHGDPSRLEL
jgi:hypothetical protein